MKLVFDDDKNRWNILKRGLSFERAADFDFSSALYAIDERRDYGERRIVALGYLEGRLHALCFTPVQGGIRVISFRKANAKEARKHGLGKTRD
jgi:uncharacterized DUF497 family protein